MGENSGASQRGTYRLPARDADVFLVDELELVQRAVGRVVEGLELVFLPIHLIADEVGNVNAVADVLVAILVGENAEGDGEAVLGAVGADPGLAAVGALDLGALHVISVGVLTAPAAHVIVLLAGVVLGALAVVASELAVIVGQLAELMVLLGVLELFVGELAVPAVLDPLLVDIPHALLAELAFATGDKDNMRCEGSKEWLVCAGKRNLTSTARSAARSTLP